MGVGIECDRIYQGHVDLSIYHDAFVSRDIDHLANHTAAVLIALIFDKFAFQAERELVNHGSIHGLGLACGKACVSQLVGDFVAGCYAEIVGFDYMSRIGEDGPGVVDAYCEKLKDDTDAWREIASKTSF